MLCRAPPLRACALLVPPRATPDRPRRSSRRSSRCRCFASFAVSPGRRTTMSTPPMKHRPVIRRTGSSGEIAAGGATCPKPPMIAMPLASTARSGGTMISAPPIMQNRLISVTPGGSTTSRKSSSAPPMTVTTMFLRPGCQRPLRSTPPMIAISVRLARISSRRRSAPRARTSWDRLGGGGGGLFAGRSCSSCVNASAVVARCATSRRASKSSSSSRS